MTTWRLDFGDGAPAAGYVGVDATTRFTPGSGPGWVSASGLEVRDRKADDPVLGRFVYGKSPATLRISVAPGRYALRLIMGDKDFPGHILELTLGKGSEAFPPLTAAAAEYAMLKAIIEVQDDFVDLTFSSPINNWVVNSVVLEPIEGLASVGPSVTRQEFGIPYEADAGTNETTHGSLAGGERDRKSVAERSPVAASFEVTDTSGKPGHLASGNDGESPREQTPSRGETAHQIAGPATRTPVALPATAKRGTSDKESGGGLATRAVRAFGSFLGL
nr:hypothetical protein [uncultured Rhodopila sp.]